MVQADPNKVKMVQSAMARASKLMQLESNGSLDKIAKAHKNDINMSLSNDNITTESMVSTKRNRKTTGPIATQQMTGAGAANVPSIIRESFATNQIDDSALYSALGNDGLDVSFLTEGLGGQTAPQVRQIVNEGIQQPQTFQTVATQQIDYPMIRTIVEETVRKYTASLKKSILSEGKQGLNEIDTLVLGNGFKFLDKAGNIYECSLKKIGNVNNKKKAIKE